MIRSLAILEIAGTVLFAAPAEAVNLLYTFTGVVTSANNSDATGTYANVGDPISFSLGVKAPFPTVIYTYESTNTSATGGPDYTTGTLFPIDRIINISPNLGYSTPITPLATGYNTNDDYSAAISKDSIAHSLSFSTSFSQILPGAACSPNGGCFNGYKSAYSLVQVFSDEFSSADYREVGNFDLSAGSMATLGDTLVTRFAFGDSYDLALSHLTVERLPDAVPEPAAWALMIVGIGMAGFRMRHHTRFLDYADK